MAARHAGPTAGGRASPPDGVPDRALAVRRRVMGPLTRLLNRPVRALAERRLSPVIGVLYHRGRRSGRVHATPVGVGTAGDHLLLPLTFGVEANWCRNVLAASGCVVRLRGGEYAATDPVVVDAAAVRPQLRAAFGLVTRTMLRLMGTRQLLRLRIAGPGEAGR